MRDRVRFPQWRSEIVANIEELASGTLDKSITPVGSRFLEIFDVLYDEARLDDVHQPTVGEFVANEEEAHALRSLAEPLRRVLADGQGALGNEPYLHSASWDDLQAKAVQALGVFRAAD